MTRPARLLVVHRSRHHATHSGHAAAVAHLQPDATVDGTGPSSSYLLAHAASRIRADRDYGSLGVQREVEAWRTGRHHPEGASIHILGAEHDARHLPRVASRSGLTTSAWFHVPPPRLAEVLERRPGLRHLDRAWAVSSTQLPVLEEHLGADRVGLMLHGVDVDWFAPPATPRPQPRRRVLFVGVHLRDFAQLARVYRRLEALDPTIERRIVIPSHSASLVRDIRAEVHVGISDEQYLHELQTAGVVFLPFLDCTANNSLLEAFACGTPVVASDAGAVREYAGPAAALVPPHDDDAAIHAIRAVLDDPEGHEVRSRATRAQAERFAWPAVTSSFRWAGERASLGGTLADDMMVG